MADPVRDRESLGEVMDPPEAVEISGAWLNILFGVLVMATPVYLALGGVALWNALLSGLAVIVLAGVTWWSATRGALDVTRWSAVGTAIVGAWVLVGPFVLGIDGFYLWALVTLGLLVAFTAAYNAWEAWAVTGTSVERSRA